MILANHGIISSSGTLSFDSDAQAVINAIEGTSTVLTTNDKFACNELIVDLKNYGVWDKIKVLYGFLGGTASAHKFNWKDPRDLDASFRLVFYGGWTHTITGAKPNGTTAWATTKFNPVTQLTTQSSNHLSFYSRTNIDESTVDMGSYTDPGLGYDIESRISNILYSFNGIQAVNINFSNTDSKGLFINSRTGNNIHKVFINGIVRGTNINNFLSLPNTDIALATRYNVSTGLPQSYSSKEQAFASMGDGLLDTEASNLYIAIQKYNTLLNRQV